MAAPVIRSVTATSTTLQPGQSTVVTIDAFDPDARTIVLTASATDSQSNTTTNNTTTITIGDPLTFALTSDDPSVTITPDPTNPNKFTVQV